MAHIANLKALTDELIALFLDRSTIRDPGKFNTRRESALRLIRHNNFPRTNSFEVISELDGLEEKFRVFNEEPLADALRERLDTVLKTNVKWTAEILQLLLHLSENPLKNSKVADLDLLIRPDQVTGPHLKWEDIIDDDPLLREKSVWGNVDFGAESSDDDFGDSHSESTEITDHTASSSTDLGFASRSSPYLAYEKDEDALDAIRGAQFWTRPPTLNGVKLESMKTKITELQAIREIIFMLSGLPTSIFDINDDKDFKIEPSASYVLRHIPFITFYDILQPFADQGSSLRLLRSFTKQQRSIPLIQVLQSAVSIRVHEFDERLSDLQKQYLSPQDEGVISIIRVQNEVDLFVEPLVRLSTIIKQLEAEPYAHAFRYLELLYDATCLAQIEDGKDIYTFMGNIFFECFQVYLKPIKEWMEEGQLNQGDSVFFVSESSTGSDPALIWQSLYKIRQTPAGVLHAPKFIHTAAKKIFTTGKSVVVLKHLNRFRRLTVSNKSYQAPSLDFATVCSAELRLAPFPELFSAAFSVWIESKHHHVSATLRQALFDEYGLHESLEALSNIFYFADGATATAFLYPMFDKLDLLSITWNDRFALSEQAQSAFGNIPVVSPQRLRIVTHPLPRKLQDVIKCRRSVKALSIIEPRYFLPWPVQMVITPASISSQQRVFTFLVQIRRTLHILGRQHQVKNSLSPTNSSDECALYHSLRSRLLWFIHTLYYYMTQLVISPCLENLKAGLHGASDVDAMIEVHSSCTGLIIDRALLGSKLVPIHKTIVKTLNLAIKLEDAQAMNTLANKEALERQEERMGLSIASLGLQTPKKNSRGFVRYVKKPEYQEDSSSDEGEFDVDLSILSATYDDDKRDETYIEKLREMREDFDNQVRFIASGLRGVARAGPGEAPKTWDILGEMLESGLSYKPG